MKKILFWALAFVSVVLPFPLIAATPADFEYVREIRVQKPGPQWIILDEQIFAHSQLTDIRVISDSGIEAAHRVVNQPYKLLSTQAKVVTYSSVAPDYRGQSFSPSNMFDGNVATVYAPDPSKDGAAGNLGFVTSFTVDVGEQALIRSLAIEGTKTAASVQIETSADNQAYATVVTKRPLSEALSAAVGVRGRYVRFTFWYATNFQVSELKLFGDTQARLMFAAAHDQRYSLYYGNPLVGAQQNTAAHAALVATIDTPTPTLASERKNPSYTNDIDGDGIANNADTCPYRANGSPSEQRDSDNDGVGDACDNAPTVSNAGQTDTDHDGVGDGYDNCRYLKNPDQRDSDLDSIGDICDDDDADGVVNSQDNCPVVRNYSQEDLNNNGTGDACEADYDNDGVPQAVDNCRNTANASQEDGDNDGIGNACDNCPTKRNADQLDVNENKLGDACEADTLDDDQDGIVNSQDTCVALANADQLDVDGDGIGDACDNCRELKNASQLDTNKDGVGDICGDDDGDGISTVRDNCQDSANADQADADNDGIGDACEDTDADGILNARDNCKFEANPNQRDMDRDGLGDTCDETDSRWTEQNPWLVWAAIIIAFLVLAGLGFRLVHQASRPTMKIEESANNSKNKKKP